MAGNRESEPQSAPKRAGVKATLAERSSKSFPFPLSQDLLWQKIPDEPVFAAFADWVHRYTAAPTAEAKKALEAEGISLAGRRLSALADLVVSNPERAFELAVPRGLREMLPQSVRDLLEVPVNTKGDLQVVAALPIPGVEPTPAPVSRSATIDGIVYQAYTYGPMLQWVTHRDLPLNGFTVPRIGVTDAPAHPMYGKPPIIALGPPGRRLEPSEVPKYTNAIKGDVICPTSGQPVTTRGEDTWIEFGGNIHAFCGEVHAEDWVNARIAASGAEVPGSDVPVAESPYTEGRKRMLLMLPIWSDYMTPAMATNAAVTHFLNFSNYMYEMSYGKMVLAGLGQGSDITPPMVLPGLVADYDNTGLGKLYDTCKGVAQTNYGYNVSSYDFPYVCTSGKPAAGYCGLAFVGGVGFHLACFGADVACHEFGHNLGLNHAHFWDTSSKSTTGSGVNVEYGDNNDPMGGGGSPNSYNSRYKNYLGWIPDSDIVDLNVSGSGRYRLYCFDLDYVAGTRGLKFRYSSSQNYWLNFRQRKTSKKALMNGVQLLWTGNGNQGSYLLDVRVKGNADDNAIVIGRTFSDTNLAFHVTPIGKGNTFPESIDVVVNVGSFPGNRAPLATVGASTTNPAVSQTVTFTASASDADGDTLAYYWDFGDGDYSVDNSAVTTHTFAAAGEYTAQCVVSDMKGGTARHSLVIRVGNPSTFRISGHVVDARNRPMAGIRVSAGARVAYTDSDGSYTISGLAAGNYSIDAIEPVAGNFTFAHPYFLNPVSVGPNYTTADLVGIPSGTLNLYTTLSPKLSVWKYLDDGSDQGTNWINAGFNDSGWSNGPAVLGYGETVATTIRYGPDANNKYITYYFRREFTVTNTAAFTNLLLEALRDDGIVVYLNGKQVFSDNMPNGPINYHTFASTTVEAGAYLQTNLPISLVQTGINEFAAEVHQSDVTSSDIIFDAALSGLSVSNAAGLNIVYLTNPSDNDTFIRHTAVEEYLDVNAKVFTADSVSQVRFFVDGAILGTNSTEPYSVTWTNPPIGNHILTAVSTIGSLQVTSPPVHLAVSAPLPPPISLSLLQTGSVWRYLAGPTSAPPTWQLPSYNDITWSNGPAQLGYGEGDERTVIPGGPTSARWPTYYFRTTFVVTDPTAITNFTAHLLRDDGAVVYINGIEVLRDNIPFGPVTYGTLATNAADDGQVYFTFALDPSFLTPGTNLVAVEVHQTSPTSSDVSFDLGLDALFATNRSRGIWLVAPAEGATISAGATLSAQVVAGGLLGVTKVEFYSDGSKIGETISSPFDFIWTDAPAGSHALQAVATDIISGSMTSDVVNVTVSPPPTVSALVSFGETWKYLDDGSNQGINWRVRTFDDHTWMAGPAKLGYGGDGEVTTVSYGTNANSKYITTYFRKSINVTNPVTSYSRLLLRLIRDDGAVVYVNGNEVYRNNLLVGPVSFNSLATIAVEGVAETAILDISLAPTNLISGSNAIAVEIHQAATNSSDIGFDLALFGLKDTNLTQGIYLTSPPNNARFKTPANVAVAAYAQSDSPVTKVEYYVDGAKFSESAASPYSSTWSNAPVGVHTLIGVASDSGGMQWTSPPVTVIIGQPPPPISPVFQTYITPSSSGWRYWDKVASVQPGWQDRSFDDAGWSNAPCRFGWGLDGEMTKLTVTNITHYFRRWFNIANPGLLSKLLFELVRDDGAVVYLNGIEIFRSNMPAGAISSSTFASTTVDTPNETTWFETALATSGSGLLSGSNLLAVELHQASANSSDGSFDFALYGDGTTESRLYVSYPVNNSVLPNTFPITIEAAALAASGLSVSNVEFFIDGGKVSQTNAFPYRYTWASPALGVHLLTARLTDSSGATLDSTAVRVTVTRELISTTFIPVNSTWKYLDNGSNQGTNWSQLSYNDSTWKSGPARLGYGGDGEVTTNYYGTDPNNKYITTYYRRSFVVPDGLIYTNLDFRLLRDDGAVVWLNGRELYRSNMPPSPAVIAYTTLASGTVSGTDEQTFFPTTIATNLATGTNVIAVEMHQVLANSSDLGFNLEMIASGFVQTAIPPLLSIALEDGMIVLSWPDTGLIWSVYSSPDLAVPASSWTRVSADRVLAGGRYSVTVALAPGNRFFRLNRP